MKSLPPSIAYRSRSIALGMLLVFFCVLIMGCQTTEPVLMPERPVGLMSVVVFDKAIDHAVDDLLVQTQRLPEFQTPTPTGGLGAVFRKDQGPPAKIRVVVDNAVDGATGQQTVATRALDSRLLAGVQARFPAFQVTPISTSDLAAARFILTATLTALDRGQAEIPSYRVNLSLTDSRNGLVVAQAAAQATGETVDATPTNFYKDSPSLTKDRTIEGQIRTAQTSAGSAADGVYLSNLSVVALIAEGSRLYEAGQYPEAFAIYEAAAVRPEGKHLRVYNGLYLTNMQLGRLEEAERAFGRLVMLGLATNSLSVKFFSNPVAPSFGQIQRSMRLIRYGYVYWPAKSVRPNPASRLPGTPAAADLSR